jgi:hypothetical protein
MSQSNDPQKIALNSRVKVILVTAREADLKSVLLDENTPLGRALVGKAAGDRIPYPLGDLVEVRVLEVHNGEGPVSPQAAQKRRADVKKATAQSEITNQMIFATASGSKWGDYDVNVDKLLDNLLKEDEEEESGA